MEARVEVDSVVAKAAVGQVRAGLAQGVVQQEACLSPDQMEERRIRDFKTLR